MPDNLTPEDRRRTMRAVKGKGTGLERRLFSMLAGMGVKGWRKNAIDVLGKPDVVFNGGVAVFVDGCFWHGCPLCGRPMPESNREYWRRKIGRNVRLSAINKSGLERQGWKVIRIWEHEMENPIERRQVGRRILKALRQGDRRKWHKTVTK